MGLFDFVTNRSSKAIEYGNLYVKSSEKYIKLKVFEQLSLTIGILVKLIIISGLSFIAALFLAIAGAIALGDLFGSLLLGCLTMALLFSLIVLLVYSNRRKIDNMIIKSMSNKFFDTNESETT